VFFFHFFGQHLLWIAAGGGLGVAGHYLQLRIRQAYRVVLPDPSVELLRLQQLYGYNAHALVAIAPGARLWSCRETQGAVSYNEFGKVWLVPGDPLASEENLVEVAGRFVGTASALGRVVGFMPATHQFAKHSNRLGLRAIKIGSAPYFDLETWAPRGDRAKKARAGVNQARRAGVRVARVVNVDEKLIRETACLRKSWLTTRRSAIKFGWLFAVDVFQHKEMKKYFTARDTTGKLVGFLAASPIPARDGWYLEDVLRRPESPNGTTDLLVVEVLDFLKRDGAKLATLGTAPMAMEGSVDPDIPNSFLLSKATRIIAGCFSLFYNFEGVRRFKAKFAPSWWESEYLLISQNVTAPPRIFSAFVQAIVPAGPSTLIGRQITRAWRRMTSAKNSATAIEKPSLVVERQNKDEAAHGSVPADPEAHAYPRKSVFVDGLTLNYVSAGSGRPVVLIHGNPGSHQDYTLAVIEKLSQSHHVLAFDRPGHGYSERHDGVETTVEVQAQIILNALRKLRIEKPVLVGHSWGGSLVLAAAVGYGNDLSGIVLLAPAAYPDVRVEWWSRLPHIPVLGKFMVNTLAPLVGRAIVKESLKEAYHPQAVHEDYAERSAEMWTRPNRVRACAYDERTLGASLKILSQQYSDVRLPVVIVTGSADLLLEPKNHAYRLHQAIKDSKLVVLPQTGHQLPQTRPDAVIEAIAVAWDAAERCSDVKLSE
jgi:pimeloyl-ACP methyl ester carboxylesterase